MSDLYELLAPSLDIPESSSTPLSRPNPDHVQTTTTYLNRLTTLSLSDLTSTEPASLLHAAQSHLRNLQALSKRSHKAVITSSTHLSELSTLLPTVEQQSTTLHNELPELETAATAFAQKYDRNTENAVLDRRKRAMLLSRNVDRVGDMMDLPTLLSSTASAASASSTQQTSTASFSSTSYASALDLHAHIKRLQALYPDSELVATISTEAAQEIDNLTSILISSLQSQNLKLAAAMRTIGWLRRVAPDLAEDERPEFPASVASSTKIASSTVRGNSDVASKVTETDGALGSLFLVCRLQTLYRTLEALEPLRELADQETVGRKQRQREEGGTGTKGGKSGGKQSSSQSYTQQRGAAGGGGGGEGGSQTERYLKRYLEIFREQSFGVVSMYKSIFPGNLPGTASASSSSASSTTTKTTAATNTAPSNPPSNTNHKNPNPDDPSSPHQEAEDQSTDPLHPLPSPLSSFSLHLVSLLRETLHLYLPNLTEKSSRESLLTQVLYCASSLGRLGADFGMVVAEVLEAEGGEGEGDREDEEVGKGEGDKDGDGDEDEGGDENEEEWIQIMRKHRIQASRLEVLARGVGSGGGGARKASGVGVESPPPPSASPSEAVAG
ncbi:hypothetical protein KC334_g3737 [Hortaea werneckii]|uniref:Conserved oligomeric Golgi complex subunit 8 n=1 Tax=Hortaea werneckii TaxID=91943 RepID=A0A3M6ZQF5_HORWE|nr:hypothetical protein KC334_g3737 [Hortaea werneckii]RMY17498.1 hypothetical protein D0866_13451 [Hortaea werneckii]